MINLKNLCGSEIYVLTYLFITTQQVNQKLNK